MTVLKPPPATQLSLFVLEPIKESPHTRRSTELETGEANCWFTPVEIDQFHRSFAVCQCPKRRANLIQEIAIGYGIHPLFVQAKIEWYGARRAASAK